MPANPDRASRGGDVSGTCKTDGMWGVGAPVTVSDASYDPGYDVYLGYSSKADLKAGYCSYGIAVGEGSGLNSPKQMSHDDEV